MSRGKALIRGRLCGRHAGCAQPGSWGWSCFDELVCWADCVLAFFCKGALSNVQGLGCGYVLAIVSRNVLGAPLGGARYVWWQRVCLVASAASGVGCGRPCMSFASWRAHFGVHTLGSFGWPCLFSVVTAVISHLQDNWVVGVCRSWQKTCTLCAVRLAWHA
jgi:hypothetical protein